MTGYVRVHCGTQSYLQNIDQSGSFEGYICHFQGWSLKSDGDTSNQWAIGRRWSRYRCKYRGGYGIESDSEFRNGNGGGYGKIGSDGGFGSRNGGGHRKWSQYSSVNRFRVDGGFKWNCKCGSRC